MTPADWPIYALVMALTGVGIPVMAALNTGLGLRLGSPFAAAAVLFGVAFALSLALAALAGALNRANWFVAPAWFYCGGFFVAFYVISITAIAPRFGVGNAIFFVLVGQLISAAAIDHFGLLGATKSELDLSRILGLLLMVAGLFFARKTG
jgi:bacterial/archaeal transporter family-2 protein